MIYLRGGLRNFLKDLMTYYELICFTKNIKYNADQIIDFIENDEEFFSYRLYIENSTYLKDEYYKELSKVGRDIKKTIIIDNKKNVRFKNENEILIKSFIKKDNDNQGIDNDYILHNLIRILIKIAREKPNDIRKSLKKYKNEIENKVN
jgi:RNA polymerase II subunit A small phosphatase-like protein